MNIDNYIKNWTAKIIKESIYREEIDETDFPCCDGLPQAEKDICTCPDCGEKMYETEDVYTSDDQIPDLMIKEEQTEEQPISRQDEMTLKEFFNKAKSENGELQVHFIKVTDNQERTVIFSNSAGVGAKFEDQKTVTPKVLKTIMKNHDRVYEQDVKYTGSLVTFPERITEQTPNVTQDNTAEDGSKWQWRRLYIQQIIDVKYNGKTVWENNGLFNFSLIGQDGKMRTTVSKDEIDKQQSAIDYWNRKMERTSMEFKALRKKAVEVAKGLTEEQCSIELGYAASNVFNVLTDEEKIRVLAIEIKHDQLCRTNPSKHEMQDTSRNPMRGDHSYHCKGCKFGYSVDSSD